MPYCAEPSCRNGTGKGNKRTHGVKFFKFPKEEALAREWWLVIKRSETFPKHFHTFSLCSDHFIDSDYQRDLKHELIHPGQSMSAISKKLLPSSKPSRNLSRPTVRSAPRCGSAPRRCAGQGDHDAHHSEPVQVQSPNTSLQRNSTEPSVSASAETYTGCASLEAEVATLRSKSECSRCALLEVQVASLTKQVEDMQQLHAPGGAQKLGLYTSQQVSGMARQKVRPAYMLVSASSALALRRHKTDKEKEADFLEMFDSGMDVLNAGHPGDVKTLRRGYSGRPDQEATLTALAEEAAGMRVGKAKHMYPFQKGLLVTVRAVRGLLKDLQDRYGSETFLLTRHLTQDKLESFFGQVRGRGGSSMNPTPTEAKARLRLLTLLQLTRHGVNLKQDVEEEDGTAAAGAETTLQPGRDIDEDVSLSQQLLELEGLCPELDEEVPEGTEGLHPPPEEPASDAEEDAEQATVEEMASLLSQAGEVHAPGEPSGGADVRTGVSASDSAMAYLAGYMARKRDRSLGAPAPYAEDVPVQALWTRLRSVCALTIPTAACLELFRQLETTFCAHHAHCPGGLSRERGIIADMTTVLLEKHGNAAEPERKKFIRTFARVRTFIRLRHLNAARRTESANKRKARKLQHHAQ